MGLYIMNVHVLVFSLVKVTVTEKILMNETTLAFKGRMLIAFLWQRFLWKEISK